MGDGVFSFHAVPMRVCIPYTQVGARGLYQTAFEVGKLLLSLDPTCVHTPVMIEMMLASVFASQ